MAKNKEMQVRSFNAWENSDLGDASRKEKFLKLMGAGKKQDSGRNTDVSKPSFGQLARSREESEKIDNDLSKQYQTSLMHTLTGSARQHVGLGFQDMTKKKGIDVNKTNPNKVVFDSDSDSEKTECSKRKDQTTQQIGTETGHIEQYSGSNDEAEQIERTKAEKKAAKKLKKQKASKSEYDNDDKTVCDTDSNVEKNAKKNTESKRKQRDIEPDVPLSACDDELVKPSKAERKAAKKLKKLQSEASLCADESSEDAKDEKKTEKSDGSKKQKRKSDTSEYVDENKRDIKCSKADENSDNEHLEPKPKKKAKKHKSDKNGSDDC